jgi:glucose-6-phosphate 1-epimerase
MEKGFKQDLGNNVSMHGALPRLVVDHPTATGEVFLHGAHVTAWQPRGHDPVLFLSPRSMFAPDQPIRGGIPICFPWFGPHSQDPKLPTHGFARTLAWEPVQHLSDDDGATVHTRLRSMPNKEGRGNQFVIDYHITFGRQLKLRFIINNVGKQAFDFELALHTYFAVSDVRNIGITGLQGVEYISKAEGMARKKQEDEIIRFTGETDRVYLNTEATCTIDDPGMGRRITIEKTNAKSTVVWNPFNDRAGQLKDLGSENWPGFVCVESGNVNENMIHLDIGGRHETTVTIGVEKV